MSRRRTLRKFAGVTSAKNRTTRLLRTVANELERLGVRWNATAEDAYLDLANSMTVSPSDSDFEAVSLDTPRGIRGCLLVHRAILSS